LPFSLRPQSLTALITQNPVLRTQYPNNSPHAATHQKPFLSLSPPRGCKIWIHRGQGLQDQMTGQAELSGVGQFNSVNAPVGFAYLTH
jgi:hypothetical protein